MNRHEPGHARHSLMLHGAIGLVALSAMAVLAPACLDRPVAPQQPSTSKLSTKLYSNKKVDKIDLLFMIDNSASMADKQLILADAVPDLLNRLTNPVCVDRQSRAWDGNTVAPGQPCPDGKEREFDPIKDIHIGVITSSIGGHGADSCSDSGPVDFTPRQADMSHLITRGKNPGETTFHDVQTWDNKGFLNWDQAQKDSPVGDNDVDKLVQKFTDIVRGAGEDGCGFEAQLESWYRFLVDPAPYVKMVSCPCYDGDVANQCRCPDGLDTMVLQQRADMIRQDSLMAVVMLTDENDCSIMDGGQSYLALQALDGSNPFHVPRGTNACLTDPWSSDCKSCWEVNLADPAQAAAYPECAAGWSNAEKDDPLNLRCFEQKRRFGISFLQPIQRYVAGLNHRVFCTNNPDPAGPFYSFYEANCPWGDSPYTGTINPLFCSAYAATNDPNNPIDRKTCAGTQTLRDPSLVFLAGVVGVPWQDIAKDPNDLSKLYRTAQELRAAVSTLENPPANVPGEKTLWDVILGETRADGEIVPTVDPLDPLMKESIDPRIDCGGAPCTNPITGDVLAPTADGALNNKINGSEWDVTSRADLQYACVFDLPTPIDPGGDCNYGSSANPPVNPLCYDKVANSYGTKQYRAKAYPDRRELAVLKGVGDQAIVASICPAKADPNLKGDADWGYRPAIAAIVDRLKAALAGTCWDVPLPVDAEGLVPCIVLEATKSTDVDAANNVVCPACDDGSGVRSEATSTAKAALATDATYNENGLNCVCEVNQIQPGPGLDSCKHDDLGTQGGWCYLDDTDPNSNKSLLDKCPADQKRLIHFVSIGDNEVPKSGSLTFLQCKGATLGQ